MSDDIHRVVISCDLNALRELLGRGVNVDAADEDGLTPLMVAYQMPAHFSNDAVELLIEAGASLGSVDNDGETVLMYAARCAEYEVFERFLHRFVGDVNEKDLSGKTAINWLVRKCRGEPYFSALIDHGADPYLEDKLGINAIESAKVLGVFISPKYSMDGVRVKPL